MSPAATFRRTCSVGPNDSRRPSHAPLAYDGNLVVYINLRLYNHLNGLGVYKWPPKAPNVR